MIRKSPRAPIHALLLLLSGAAAATCFNGDRLLGQACVRDDECNPRLDVLGERLRCEAGICALSSCGDGQLEPHEECDDGNDDDDDGCLHTCHAYVCGDGLVSPLAEGCDDADLDDADGCTNACRKVAVAIGGGPMAAHACAISEGRVRCWGRNGEGQLGRGNTANLGDEPGELPAQDVPIGDDDDEIVQVVAGASSTCVRLRLGEVRCWGLGVYGITGGGEIFDLILGDDDGDLEGLPIVALGGPAVDVSAGGEQVCALLGGGAVRCWGLNEVGQAGQDYDNFAIGDDETPASLGDIPLPGPAAQVVTGQEHSCARLVDGAVHCWGWSDAGALGVPGIDLQEPPGLAVELGEAALQIAAGAHHTCALLEGGAVVCWGRGSDGALGYGDVQDVGDDESPAAVGPVPIFTAEDQVLRIAAGANHNCALLEGGELRCWGLGWSGELGYGDFENLGDGPEDPRPTRVDVGGEVIGLALGDASTCVLLEGGVVRCWGRNSEGQLGRGDTEWVGDQAGEMPPMPSRIYETPARFVDDPGLE